MQLDYITDGQGRHLICLPYSVENLHQMGQELEIDTCWFHEKGILSHYDIPKNRIQEISDKCRVVNTRQLYRILKAQS